MHEPRGITIKELNDTLEQMRTIYNFKDEATWFGDNQDPRCMTSRRVEINTVDDATGICIMLAKNGL